MNFLILLGNLIACLRDGSQLINLNPEVYHD